MRSLLSLILRLSLVRTCCHAWWLPKPFGSQVPDLSVKSTDFDGSVIIIGAGAAGLSAAYTLAYLGVTDVTILEARSDYGGRVRDMDDFIDVPLDTGAEWIHTRPRVLQDLLLMPGDRVTEDWIRYRPWTIRWEIRDWIQIPLGWIGAWFYREWKFYDTTWKHYFGKYFVPYVEQNLVLNTPVTAIDTTGDRVVVTTADGTQRTADKVIVAVPPTTLKQRNITFTPDLSDEKWTQIDKIRMPPAIKVYMEFSHRFYAQVTLMDVYLDRFYANAVYRKPTDRNVLLGFNVDDETTAWLAEQTDDEIFEYCRAELDELFHGRATENYLQHRVFNWAREPYIEGSWAPNDDFSHGIVSEPVEAKVYFAGDYLYKEWQSTVHGAAISGRKAVDRMLRDVAAASVEA